MVATVRIAVADHGSFNQETPTCTQSLAYIMRIVGSRKNS